MDRAQTQIRSLEQRRGALVVPQDRSSAEARLRDAESAVTLAEDRVRKSVIRAPLAGTIYQFDLKPGAYLNAGDLVASIGQLDKVRVKVFVDEPDLGRVARGKPVVITWDAMPEGSGKAWWIRLRRRLWRWARGRWAKCSASSITPHHDLLPGTNVNVDITAEEAPSALTIPKEAVRREVGQAGVFMLAGNTLAWKKITLGVSNTTRAQVEGLNENDAVALPSEKPLKDGMVVTPRFQ